MNPSTGTKQFSYVLLNYLKGTNKFKDCTSPYFMDKGYIILAHKLTGKSVVYMTAPKSVRNLKNYYTSYSYNEATNTVQITLKHANLVLAAKSIMGKPAKAALPAGAYWVYIVTGITAIAFTKDFNLCTLSYAGDAQFPNKFNTNVIMQYEFKVN